MKYNKTTSCEKCHYAMWDSVYDGDEDIDYISECEKGNKISDNENCKDYKALGFNMLWDDMTEEEKRNCYDSYVQELKYEWGDNAKPIPFEMFDIEWSGQIYVCV